MVDRSGFPNARERPVESRHVEFGGGDSFLPGFAVALPLDQTILRENLPLGHFAVPLCGSGLCSFCFGVCVAGIAALKLWNQAWGKVGEAGWPLMLLGLLGQAWVQLNPPVYGAIMPELFHWAFRLGSGLVLCYAAAPENPRARWLCAPWLRWCGIISYEWYLFHQPMLLWSRERFGPAHGNIFKYSLILAVPVVGSLVFSALVYRIFSLPILKLGRSKNVALK